MTNNGTFPSNSREIADETAKWFIIVSVLAIILPVYFLATTIQTLSVGLDESRAWIFSPTPTRVILFLLSAVILPPVIILFQLIPFYNLARPIEEALQAALTNFRNSTRRKKELVESVNSLAQKLANEEYGVHQGIATTAKEAAKEIARGGSAAIILANLASQFPSLNSSASFQTAQENADRVEQKIDSDLRELNSLITGYNYIVTMFPTVIFARLLGFRRMEHLSDESSTP